MSLIKTEVQLQSWLNMHDRNNKSLGFVPTMGALHKGHQSLIKEAKQNNDIVVVSIFVNPLQFGPKEDFNRYPGDIEKDYIYAKEAGADVVFYPDSSEIYAPGFSTEVEVKGALADKLCGISRPSHFKGVTTVISILFHIVRPDRAYFGQKDAQQAAIIKKMIHDLHIPIELVICPIVREADGLARSSRNIYLNIQERIQATSIYRGLSKAKDLLESGSFGCNHAGKLIEVIQREIEKEPLAQIEYIQILDFDLFETIQMINPSHKALAAVAVRFGDTRLIDNMILEVKEVMK